MSFLEVKKLVDELSEEQRQELFGFYEQPQTMTDEEWENDPAKAFLDALAEMPALDLPPDFGANHNHYIHGAPKKDA